MSFTRCTRCLMPATRPDTAFVAGVCSACISFDKRKEIDWAAREQELLRILEAAPKNSSGYDCIVPSSAGKDSHWQTLKLIELGAKPLVVTATTCMLTDVGRKNIDNLARYATTIEVTPRRDVRAKLNKLGLELVGDCSHPEHMSIFSTPFRMASDMNISLCFFGESPQREYGSPLGAEEQKTMTRRWIHEFGGLLGLRAFDFIGMDGITASDMADYMLPPDEKLEHMTAYFLGQFYQWNSHRNAKVAADHGMIGELPSPANLWVLENQDSALTGLHDHAMWRKFGYGRLCAQISVDIRNGLISRSEALEMVRERDGLFPHVYMGVPVEDVCSHIGITRDHLMSTLDKYTNWDLFSHVEDGRPILKEFSEAREAA